MIKYFPIRLWTGRVHESRVLSMNKHGMKIAVKSITNPQPSPANSFIFQPGLFGTHAEIFSLKDSTAGERRRGAGGGVVWGRDQFNLADPNEPDVFTRQLCQHNALVFASDDTNIMHRSPEKWAWDVFIYLLIFKYIVESNGLRIVSLIFMQFGLYVKKQAERKNDVQWFIDGTRTISE